MKTLSLIIPAYNSQQFLGKVIASILDANIPEKLEILLVNDGSTDETPDIIQDYAQRYPDTIRAIHQENKGHGGALNTGCAAARGKFLKVIDADDWVNTPSLKDFVSLLDTCDSDVVLTHHHTVDISTGEIKSWKHYPEIFGKSYTLPELTAAWKSFNRSLTFHGITYNTAFYRQFGISLSEHIFYEDHEFAAFPCCHARSITPVDLFIYEYRIGDVQQSVSDANQLKRLSHIETVLERMIAEYQKLPAGHPGQEYVARKARDLLMRYLTLVMLVLPDRKRGRALGHAIMNQFRQNLPAAADLAQKQYHTLRVMNRLRLRQNTLNAVLRSGLYNRLRGNHDFN